ncbi:MAG: hypothetical protein HAW66_06115 [Shewanella sp.]|nr:hypothetical protein [Shewanella sp.]
MAMAKAKETDTFTSFAQFKEPETTLAITRDTTIKCLEKTLTTIDDSHNSHIYICTFADCKDMHSIFHVQDSSQDLKSSYTSNTEYIPREKRIGLFVAAPEHFYSQATCSKADKARGKVVIANILAIKTSKDEAIRRFQSLGRNSSKICNYLKKAERCECGVIKTPISENEGGDGLTVAQIKALFALRPTQNTLEIPPEPTFECITRQLESVDTSLIYRCTEANFETVHQGFHNVYEMKKTERDNSATIKRVDNNTRSEPIGSFVTRASLLKRLQTTDSEKDEQAYAVSVIVNVMLARTSLEETIDRLKFVGIKIPKYLQRIKSSDLCECGMIEVTFDRNDISEALTVNQIIALMYTKEEFTTIEIPKNS